MDKLVGFRNLSTSQQEALASESRGWHCFVRCKLCPDTGAPLWPCKIWATTPTHMHEWTEFATAEIRYTLFPTPYSFIAIFILLWFFFSWQRMGSHQYYPESVVPSLLNNWTNSMLRYPCYYRRSWSIQCKQLSSTTHHLRKRKPFPDANDVVR